MSEEFERILLKGNNNYARIFQKNIQKTLPLSPLPKTKPDLNKGYFEKVVTSSLGTAALSGGAGTLISKRIHFWRAFWIIYVQFPRCQFRSPYWNEFASNYETNVARFQEIHEILC